MKDVIFFKDTRKENIVSALLSGQKKMIIDKVEVFLTPLKKETYKNRNKQAIKQAEQLIKLLDE